MGIQIMKLSKETLDVLKNFSTINPNILIKPGNILSTISVASNIVAEATIDESFDKEFGIYELNNFLSVYNITNNGDIYIRDNHLDISWDNNKIRYVFADKEVLTYPQNSIKFPTPDVEVEISSDVIKTAGALKSTHLGIISNGTNVKLKTFDLSNPSSNSYELDLDVEYSNKFDAILDINTLKIIPGTYNVKISNKGITSWENLERPVRYYIALDTASKF